MAWSTVRLVIILALILDWHIESIDFVLAFPQALVQTDTFMLPPRVPDDFRILDLPSPEDRFSKVYKLLRNLYGLKDAGRTWYQFLLFGLERRGWKQSDIDSCLFTKGTTILILYVDDAILVSPNKSEIASCIKSLQEEFSLTAEGPLQDYLGIRFDRKPDGTIELTQPQLIQHILSLVGLDPDCADIKVHDTPASTILQRDENGPARLQTWNYQSAIGCLSYLQAMIRPDITYAVQQCARFGNNPCKCHEEAVKRLCRYLHSTKDRGLTFKPDKSKGIECFVDADWAGSWHKDTSNDPLSANSRTGYWITFAGCPIVWNSKMQQLITLSTTEAEYIALSTALHEVISIMNLLNKFCACGFPIDAVNPKVRCKVFEDNAGCIEVATNHKMCPCTKHLSVRLHHFRSYVQAKLITVQHVSTSEQLADLFTKPLPRDQFRYLRDHIMGWSPSSIREGV